MLWHMISSHALLDAFNTFSTQFETFDEKK